MFHKILRRYGIAATISALTFISIFLSVAVTLGVDYFLKGGTLGERLAVAILAPTITVPTMSFHMLRIISHLDKAEEKLQILSHTDELTQVYNRRYFLQFGEQGIMRAKEHNEPFSIAILDLDNFKQINDQYGHLMGDQVLRELSALLRKEIRHTDVFARYGGDEFIFLFPQTDGQQSTRWAERIFKRFAGLSISLDGVDVQPSFSIGIASFNCTMSNLDDLLKEADLALYRAKNSGGNKFVLA